MLDAVPQHGSGCLTRRRCAKSLAVAIVLGYVAFALRASWLPALAQWLDVGGPLTNADIVLALPGDDERRPFVAASLVNVGLARKVAVVENAKSSDEHDGISFPAHVVTSGIYKARGLQSSQIVVLRGQSTSTAEDLESLHRYLHDHAEERACIVTNAFHTRRTRWTIRNRLPDVDARINIFSAPNPEFDCQDWWQFPESLECVLSEYLKLGWYSVKFGNSWMFVIAGGTAVLLMYFMARAFTFGHDRQVVAKS